jgi:hypothetical protein
MLLSVVTSSGSDLLEARFRTVSLRDVPKSRFAG